MTIAPTPISRPTGARRVSVGTHGAWLRQLLWLCAACGMGFLLPFLLTDVVDVPRDAYYAIYIAAVLAFLFVWTRASALSVRSMLTRNPKWTLVLGLAGAAVLARIAFTFDATTHPHGLTFAGAILWRGLAYGAVDGLLLGAFPVLAVFTAFPFERGRAHLARTVGTGALALLAALAITAAYHLGYRDFRGSKVASPMRGAAIWSAPTLLTLNPLGAVVSHAGLHVAAVVHSYDGDTFLPPHAAAAPPTIALRGCMLGSTPARCATLSVPENPGDPHGKRISLNVAVVKAQSASPKPDPLFWFAGWGGAGVTDDAANVIPALSWLNSDRDLVFVDQRGTGSSKLVCRLPDGHQVGDVTPADVSAAARRCADRIGPNLRYYTSAVAVDDFDLVRQALGYDEINIYGGSYGVTTGQIYLLRHGSHVRTAVFDSGSLLDVRIFEQGAPNAQRALDLLFDRCAADTACRTAYPNLRRDFARITARVARAPVPIPGTDSALTPLTFASVVDDLIAYTPGKAAFPRLIHLVAAGELARAAATAPPAEATTDDLAYKLLIECNEPWASRRQAEVDRLAAGTFLEPIARLSAKLTGAGCKGFPTANVPANIGERVRSSVPVLFLTGNEDPADPPANVAGARRELPNSRTVIFPGAGHGQLGLPCAQTLIADFFARGSATGLDTSCARTAALQPFDTTK
jgi:pimeloyl-ACP methyl ester carboxylesterase